MKIIDNLKDYYFDTKKKINIIISFIIIFLLFSFALIMIYNAKSFEEETKGTAELLSMVEEEPKEMAKEYLYVDVKGEVKKPGVYKLEVGLRVNDAIKASGGLLSSSNTRYINLSKVLEDSMVIVVYSNKEIEEQKKRDDVEILPCVCEKTVNDSCVINDEEAKENNALININTANVEELDSLDGIGEAKAKAIILYRETNGLFEKMEDIINVNGISESIYDKIKNSITIK